MIDFVYFDLGNVLIAFDPGLSCQRVAELYGVTEDHARVAIYDSGWQHDYESGKLTSEEFAERIHRRLAAESQRFDESGTALSDSMSGSQARLGLEFQQILDAAADMFSPIDGMVDVVRSVRDFGLGVGLLSNTCPAHWGWIQRQKYAVMKQDFDATVLSFEVGVMKPDRRIYGHAQQAAGVDSSRILFLDDREENVAAAIDSGWRAVCCRHTEDVTRALQTHGVITD